MELPDSCSAADQYCKPVVQSVPAAGIASLVGRVRAGPEAGSSN